LQALKIVAGIPGTAQHLPRRHGATEKGLSNGSWSSQSCVPWNQS
jgi:hypothetical protein